MKLFLDDQDDLCLGFAVHQQTMPDLHSLFINRVIWTNSAGST